MELCEMELGKDVQTSQFFSSNQQAQKISAPPETSILLRIIKCIENSGVFPALDLLWAIIWCDNNNKPVFLFSQKMYFNTV